MTVDATSPSLSTNYLPSRNLFSRLTRRSAPPSRDRSPSVNYLPPEKPQEGGIVQVSVLVAMPSSSTSSLNGKWVESGVPDVVMGVAQLPCWTADSEVTTSERD